MRGLKPQVDADLRIVLQARSPPGAWLRITGDLDEQATKELASCWTTAASGVGSRTTVLDLTAHIGPRVRRRFLEMFHQEGVEFLARSDFQSYLVAGITGAAQAYFRRRVEAVEESEFLLTIS